MNPFLSMGFQIQPTLEHLLDKASKQTTLSTLRILFLSHTLTSELITDLKVYGLFPSANPSRNPIDPSVDSGAGKQGDGGQGNAVGSMLDGCLEEVFAPFLEGVRYLERESKSLAELYAGFLARFTKYHVRLSFCYYCCCCCF